MVVNLSLTSRLICLLNDRIKMDVRTPLHAKYVVENVVEVRARSSRQEDGLSFHQIREHHAGLFNRIYDGAMVNDAGVRLIQYEAVEVVATYQGLLHRENGDILAEVSEHRLHLVDKVCLRSDDSWPLTILLLVHGDQNS